jgi:hypothetical protein
MEKELLRLFKCYLSNDKFSGCNEEALKYGIIISKNAGESVTKEAISMYGKDGLKWNQTFHKSFGTVRDSSIETLVIQQIVHYITTYGFESLGIYSEDSVYIPKESLDIPSLTLNDDIKLINIMPKTEDEIHDLILNLVQSGIALSKQTVNDIINISDFIKDVNIDTIKNREIKIALYDKYDKVPENPEDFLRYMIYKLTGSTLKIQDRKTIEALRASNITDRCNLLNRYLSDETKWCRLSSIFLRNKNLFLALKGKDKSDKSICLNSIINTLRKYANKNHVPMKENVMDNVTNTHKDINDSELYKSLDHISIFRIIRIINALLYRYKSDNDSVVYKVRNGKSYATTINDTNTTSKIELCGRALILRTYLANRLAPKLSGKKVYIPSNVVYTAPTSEKQFNGNFPNGSYITIPRNDCNLVYGVHWNNVGEERIDLDLHQSNSNESFGWDSAYRNSERDILFSGDITDAPLPNGATELFYVGRDCRDLVYSVSLNFFNHYDTEVPFEFIIAKADDRQINQHYVIDPNNILAKVDMTITGESPNKNIGLITLDDENINFYFNDITCGNRRTFKNDDVYKNTLAYMQNVAKTQLRLNDLLKWCGCGLVDEEHKDEADIDLSPEVLTKETLISLLSESE